MKSRAEQLMEIEAPGRGLLWMERLLGAAIWKSRHGAFIRTYIAFSVTTDFPDGVAIVNRQ